MLSSEYGWSKTAILEETYLDEALILGGLIRKRKNSEYKIALAISENPHREKPNLLWEILNGNQNSYIETEQIDREGMEALKGVMRGNPRMVIKD